MKTPRSIGTHDGTFHADEVTACALLIVFDMGDRDKILRSRDVEKLAACDFLCDVGGIYDPSLKCFDHHQASFTGHLSSAGMILKYCHEMKVISQEMFFHLNQSLILGIDAHDNGQLMHEVGVCTFSAVIANYNPTTYDASPEELDCAFHKALDFAIDYLQSSIGHFNYRIACRQDVKEAMNKAKKCLIFDHSLPWLESFFAIGGAHHPALFIIMPVGKNWKLRAIPPDYDHSMEVRLPLPKSWAGLLGNELKKKSGIEGAIFCHKGRFISVWETREDAIEALKQVFKDNNIKYEDAF
ncbi:MAG: MYG1 family protein [Chlamydiales bacterium]